MPTEPPPNSPEGPPAPDDYPNAPGLPQPPGKLAQAALRHGLLAWLRRRLDTPGLGYRAPPAPMSGGTDEAAGTWRFRLSSAPPAFDATLVLRVYAFAGGAFRVARESGILAALARAGYPVPEPLLNCPDHSVLGGAFLVMRFVEGDKLASVPAAIVPGILCKAHLALHRIDPAPVIAVLREKGVVAAPVPPTEDLVQLARQARSLLWLTPLLNWMARRLPPAPERYALCHGDFHPLNLIVRGGKLAAVLDWLNFTVADPALDVGSTLTLEIPARHVVSPAPPSGLWERYLNDYRLQSPLDDSALNYYRVRRGLRALMSAARGRGLWRRPAIFRDLIRDLSGRTGVALNPPPWAS